MAENATSSKVDATRGYGAEVILHGQIWDEANERALELAQTEGLTMIHPFDDLDLIAGQATLGMEIVADQPEVDVIIVPIGGGGLISGVATAVSHLSPRTRVIGVESSGAPAMKESVRQGKLVTLETVDTIIDGLRVTRVGVRTLAIVERLVDDIVTLPDADIFAALVWTMERCKLTPEGAAAAPIGALLHGLINADPGAHVVAVVSGGNLDLQGLSGRTWN
jgi:threonine dehydratase